MLKEYSVKLSGTVLVGGQSVEVTLHSPVEGYSQEDAEQGFEDNLMTNLVEGYYNGEIGRHTDDAALDKLENNLAQHLVDAYRKGDIK